jgi:PA14 domain
MLYRNLRHFEGNLGRNVMMGAICAAFALCAAAQDTPEGLKGTVYYIPPSDSLPNLDRLEPVGTIYTNPLYVEFRWYTLGYPGIPNRFEWFAIDYTGKIYIAKPGTYHFRLESDDGSKLYFDDKLLIHNDHGTTKLPMFMSIKLSGGMHRIRLTYFQGPRYNLGLMLRVKAPGSEDFRPFDTRDFSPPSNPAEWKYGSPEDFKPPPDPDPGRIKLKNVVKAHGGGMTVEDLVTAVLAAIRERTQDQSLENTLRKLTLGESLDRTTIEELESEGAGPKTVAALYDLREISAGQPAARAVRLFPVPPPPSIDEQKSAFRLISAGAMNYSATLPNFICTEFIRRYSRVPDPSSRSTLAAKPDSAPEWRPKDVLNVKLTYFGNREKYELTQVNGRAAERGYEASGGAVSEGDFGSKLLEIFAPDNETRFQWDHWTLLRGRLTHVFSYRTLAEHSHYRIAVGANSGGRNSVIAGRSGFVYADNETHMVMRITGEAESIPLGFGGVPSDNATFLELGIEARLITRSSN